MGWGTTHPDEIVRCGKYRLSVTPRTDPLFYAKCADWPVGIQLKCHPPFFNFPFWVDCAVGQVSVEDQHVVGVAAICTVL